MPYSVKKRGDKWVVTKKGSDKVLSRHNSKEKAQASIRARYANE